MAPRFDSARSTLQLSVADLLETQLLRSIGFSNRGGYERMWLGQAIHSRYQNQALKEDPTYRSEVKVEHTFLHHGWEVKIQGRIDGLRRDPDGALVVEEIKSIRRGSRLGPKTRELYERQAALYVWLLANSEKTEARAELILIEIGSDHIEREEVEVHLRALDAAIFRRLNGLIRAHQEEKDAQLHRASVAETLPFPYPDFRPGQEQILEAAESALESEEHLLIEASTGIGKTVASLHPVLRYALRHNKKVFVLTSKTLQQDMAVQVLQLLNREESFHSLQLRAKAKMCANDQVLCHEEYCPYAQEYYLKLQQSGLTSQLLDNFSTLMPDTIFGLSKRTGVCPFEVSLELVERCQVTVCDYNYAFEPYVALSDFSPESDLSNTILIIDEIHNLVDRGRRYYSPQLSSLEVRRAGEEVLFGGAPIHREIAELCERLALLIEDTVAEAEPPGDQESWAVEQSMPEDELWRLRSHFDRLFVDYLEYRRDTKTLTADDRFVELYFEFLKFLNALALSDQAFSHFVEKRPSRQGLFPRDDHLLCILCKDPSRFLGQVINRCHSVFGLSATLSPHEFYRDLLGFDVHRTVPLSLPNPFPKEHRRGVLGASVAPTYRERPLYYPVIAERLGEFADAVPGNCLCLFPSYKFLSEVAAQLQPEQKRVLIQRRTDSDLDRHEILETLRTAIFGDVLLLAVAGGVFAEGVDYPGEMLKAVAIVGPCLPAVTLDQQMLQEYYDERFDRGFDYAYVVPGLTRVVQAAGRLIRSPTDTGVIALFDKRFLWRTYRQFLPTDWIPEKGVKRLSGVPGEAAREFFDTLTVRDPS